MRFQGFETLDPKTATIWGAACASGVSSLVGAIGEFALQVLGVPLPVVIMSAAGAGLARAYSPPVGFWNALWLTILWTAIGCGSAPLAQAIGPTILKFALSIDIVLPASGLGALAAAIACSPKWWPIVWPMLEGRFAKKGGGNGTA